MPNGKINELIGKVPEDFRPIVEQYAPILLQMTGDIASAWIDAILRGDWQGGYRALCLAATPEQHLAICQATNDALKAAKLRSVSFDAVVRQIAQEAAKVGWLLVQAWLMGG